MGAEFISRLLVKNDSIGPEVRSLAIGSPGVSDKNLSLKLRDYSVSFWSEKDPCPRMFMYDKRHSDLIWIGDKSGWTYKSLVRKGNPKNSNRIYRYNLIVKLLRFLKNLTGNHVYEFFTPLYGTFDNQFGPILCQ